MFLFCNLYFSNKVIKENLLTFEGKLDTAAMKERWESGALKQGESDRAASKQMSLPKSISVIF